MKKAILTIALLAGVTYAQGQQASGQGRGGRIEIAATWNSTYAKVSNTNCSCFWFQGGSVDLAAPVYRRIDAAFSVAGQQSTGLGEGGLDRIDYLAGPRWRVASFPRGESRAHSHLFAEALAGAAHGFNGVFPSGNTAHSSATSYAIRIGGGYDLSLSARIGLRMAEADYVRSGLPNNGSDTQNDLRLASGVYMRF